MSEQTILVAMTTPSMSRDEALHHIERMMIMSNAVHDGRLDSWWIAEDDRPDGSDNDSAVFVSMGEQKSANWLINTRENLNDGPTLEEAFIAASALHENCAKTELNRDLAVMLRSIAKE